MEKCPKCGSTLVETEKLGPQSAHGFWGGGSAGFALGGSIGAVIGAGVGALLGHASSPTIHRCSKCGHKWK